VSLILLFYKDLLVPFRHHFGFVPPAPLLSPLCRSTPTKNYTSNDLDELLALAYAQVVPRKDPSIGINTTGTLGSCEAVADEEPTLEEESSPVLIQEEKVASEETESLATPSDPPSLESPAISEPVVSKSPDNALPAQSISSAAETDSEEYAADTMLHHWQTVGSSTEKLMAKGPPRVPILCLYSHGRPTPGRITYGDGDRSFDAPLRVDLDDGDGTVALKSLRVCADWSKRLQGRLKVKAFANVSHFDMLRDTAVVDAVMEQLQQDVLKTCTDRDCIDAAGYFSAFW
jgi:hypothetical protein